MIDPLDELRTDAAARRIGIVILRRGIAVGLVISAAIWAVVAVLASWHTAPSDRMPQSAFSGNTISGPVIFSLHRYTKEQR